MPDKKSWKKSKLNQSDQQTKGKIIEIRERKREKERGRRREGETSSEAVVETEIGVRLDSPSYLNQSNSPREEWER